MSNFINDKYLRVLQYGHQVLKTAQALPQTATSTLYTVTGGRVAICSLVGTVSTVIGSTATTLALGTVPTTGTAASGGLASATAITSKEAGTFIWLPSAPGSALSVGSNAGAPAQLFQGSAFVVSAGTISWTTSASTTGAISWALTYIPIDDGAAVS